ncbi:transpeptidase family protein [Flavobacteriales bacterium]|nr:transpeptidase family protein [Flavobacteriales bacterium]
MKSAQHIATRAWVLFGFFALCGVTIFLRIVLIQLDPSHEDVSAMLPQVRTIEPERGRILSADGHLLAASVPRFDLHWDPSVIDTEEEVKAFLTALPALAEALAQEFDGKSAQSWRNYLVDAHRSGKSRYVAIARNIAWDRRQSVQSFPWIGDRSRNRSGFMFSERPRRDKPFSPLANRTIGLHRPNGGSVGIEAAFNEALSGKSGQRLMRRIHGNYWIPATDDFIQVPEMGRDVRTTIDLRTQDVATDALRAQMDHHVAEWGCAVVMEVQTGNVVAIANLVRNPETGRCSESYNHAIGTAVEPGSTFKLASVMALLESGKISATDTLFTGEGYFYPAKGCTKMTDTSEPDGGYGPLRLEEVFERSSNVGTAKAVQQVFGNDPQAWLDALAKIGLGQPLGITLAGEGQPQIHSAITEKSWSACSLTSMSIGYEVAMTPLQTAAFYNTIAADGRLIRPRFADALLDGDQVATTFPKEVISERVASRTTIAALQSMMERVCAPGGHGTAEDVFNDRPYRVAGKTGTARATVSGGGYQGHRASFAGYFPAEKPAFTIAVVVQRPTEHGYYGGVVAAPVFRAIADHLHGTRPDLVEMESGLLAETPRLPVSMNGSANTLTSLYETLGLPFVMDTTANGEFPSYVAASTGDGLVTLTARSVAEESIPDVRGMSLRDAVRLLETRGMRVDINGRGTVRRQSIAPGTAPRQGQTILLELS